MKTYWISEEFQTNCKPIKIRNRLGTYLWWIHLSQVSKWIVKTSGQVKRKEAQHERCQHNNDHLHRLLLWLLCLQTTSFTFTSLIRPPAGLQKLPNHEAVANHHHHEGQGKHDHWHDWAVHQEVIKKLWTGGVIADSLCLYSPGGENT